MAAVTWNEVADVSAGGGGGTLAIRDADDYDNSVAPTPGQVIAWVDAGGGIFKPVTLQVASINGLAAALAAAQPADSDLTAIAALAPANDTVLQRKGGAWTARTPAQVKTDLALTYGDIGGTVPTGALPPLAISDVFVVANQVAQLALTAQRGDVAVREDNGRTYILTADTPSNLAAWREILAVGQVQSVAGKSGVVVLVKGDVGLGAVDNTSDADKPISTATQTALNGKLAASTVTTAGDLLVGTGAAAVARLGVGGDGQVLTASSTDPAGVAWADPPSGGGGGVRLSLADTMGMACVTQDPSLIDATAINIGSGTLYGCSVVLPAGRGLTHVGVGLRTVGQDPGGASKLGVIGGDGTRLGITANDATLWTAGAASLRERALLAPIAADPDDDRIVHLVMLSTCATPPTVYIGQLLTNSLFNPNPAAVLRSWVLFGQADIPAVINWGDVVQNSGIFQLYAR